MKVTIDISKNLASLGFEPCEHCDVGLVHVDGIVVFVLVAQPAVAADTVLAAADEVVLVAALETVAVQIVQLKVRIHVPASVAPYCVRFDDRLALSTRQGPCPKDSTPNHRKYRLSTHKYCHGNEHNGIQQLLTCPSNSLHLAILNSSFHT